jgi:hypothetical protein
MKAGGALQDDVDNLICTTRRHLGVTYTVYGRAPMPMGSGLSPHQVSFGVITCFLVLGLTSLLMWISVLSYGPSLGSLR